MSGLSDFWCGFAGRCSVYKVLHFPQRGRSLTTCRCLLGLLGHPHKFQRADRSLRVKMAWAETELGL